YLGRFGTATAAADWSGAPEAAGLAGGVDPALPLTHAIALNALTVDEGGGPRLVASWSFAPALLAEGDIRDLAEGWFAALAALARHAAQPGAGGRTPPDLPLVAVTQSEIEAIERRHPQIEDILPLSPLQEGLLFHALYEGQGRDLYAVQLVLTLQGPLDGATLHAAAQALIARHASLRAAFEHENLSRPVQVIVPQVAVPWRSIDLSLLNDNHRAQ